MKRNPRTIPVIFSDGTTRYFLTGAAALRYAERRGLTIPAFQTKETK